MQAPGAFVPATMAPFLPARRLGTPAFKEPA